LKEPLDPLDKIPVEKKSLEAWTKETILRIAEVFPEEQLENRATWTEYLPHAIHGLYLPHSSDGSEEIEIELLRKVGYC
jgi:hypothetical protein